MEFNLFLTTNKWGITTPTRIQTLHHFLEDQNGPQMNLNKVKLYKLTQVIAKKVAVSEENSCLGYFWKLYPNSEPQPYSDLQIR